MNQPVLRKLCALFASLILAFSFASGNMDRIRAEETIETAGHPDGEIVFDPADPINAIPYEQLPQPAQSELPLVRDHLAEGFAENTPVDMDDRIRVDNTDQFPYSAICKLHLYFYNSTTQETEPFMGTGFMITPTTLLTCAHCVYDYEHGFGEIRRIIVSPSCTSTSDPYGLIDSAEGQIESIYYDPGYIAQGDETYDCALIRLKEPVGNQCGYLRLSTGAMSEKILEISGYPAKVRDFEDPENQYKATGAPLTTYARRIEFTIPASGGQSGSPVMTSRKEACAIFAYGYVGLPVNGGVLIDTERVQFIADHSDMEKPVYRLYNPHTGEHFYTTSYKELQEDVKAGWNDEGLAWRTADNASGIPVYRLYNADRGDHHYTSELHEMNYLASIGWKKEGIAWYAPGTNEYSHIYRLYNPNAKAGQHHFTTDPKEKDYLAAHGWKYEGIPFNAR